MKNAVTFNGLTMVMPEGWVDVTDDLPDDSPSTLAKPEGVGALQFTLARYQAGASPDIGGDALQKLLTQFADSRSLGTPLHIHEGRGVHPYVAGDFDLQGELVRVWYLSNSKDVVLITYVTQQPESKQADAELLDATAIIESLEFA